MSAKHCEPAFPVTDFGYEGMTLRDYFAAKAMQGILASGNSLHLMRHAKNNEGCNDDYAAAAYAIADAMLKARES